MLNQNKSTKKSVILVTQHDIAYKKQKFSIYATFPQSEF